MSPLTLRTLPNCGHLISLSPLQMLSRLKNAYRHASAAPLAQRRMHRHQPKPATIVEPPVKRWRPVPAATQELPDYCNERITSPPARVGSRAPFPAGSTQLQSTGLQTKPASSFSRPVRGFADCVRDGRQKPREIDIPAISSPGLDVTESPHFGSRSPRPE